MITGNKTPSILLVELKENIGTTWAPDISINLTELAAI